MPEVNASLAPTRLARARRAAREPHLTVNWLRDVILGGQDGLVNLLGIALGVVAAGGTTKVLIATGMAAAITESISMGAVAYTSSLSERDHYRAEEQRERDEVRTMPEMEREEIRDIYAGKGFQGEQLEMVVDTITANPEVWVNVMMDEELHLSPVETRAVVRTSIVVTIACLIGHLIPLVPFMLLARTPAVIASVLVSGIVLFAVGVYSALTLVGDWRKSGIQMVVIGLGAAGVGFLIGRLFGATG
jgi:VIT1/CCC1 family predicted Fe2+/Mn2+ transporter